MQVNVIGAGLAGSEASLQLAKRGIKVNLYEMRPEKSTGAHKTEKFAEFVCSNSLGASDCTNASGLLKKEMELLGGELIRIARDCAVPAGTALAIDRELFSQKRLLDFQVYNLESEGCIFVINTALFWGIDYFGKDKFDEYNELELSLSL